MALPVFATMYNFFSLENALVLFLLLLMFHYLMVFYEFRNMPPGPQYPALWANEKVGLALAGRK